METTVTKNKQGYGYKYTDLAQIHEYLESNNMRYYQFITRIESDDYIMTQKLRKEGDNWIKDGDPMQGCRVVQAVLQGKSNPAQEQGSALTYARRYSLLMTFGLATDDDDAESLTLKPISKLLETSLRELISKKNIPNETVIAILKNHKYKKLSEIREDDYNAIRKELENEGNRTNNDL